MNVYLISANPERIPYPVFPIGLSYVASSLEPEHKVTLFDLILHKEEILKEDIKKCSPDLIGLSLRNVDDTRPDGLFYLHTYKRLVKSIRQTTSAPLVLGGSAFTLFPAQFMEALNADYGIIGPGEHLRVLADGLEAGLSNQELKNRVPGLCLQKSPIPQPGQYKGSVKHAQAAHSLCEEYQKVGGMINIQTKRGCPFRCIYCTYPNVEGHGVINHPVDSLVDDIEQMISHGARYLFFVDSVFNVDLEHTAAIAEEMLRRSIKIPWSALFAPCNLTRDYVVLLKKSGLTHVEFGTESLSDPVLKAYGKQFTVADAIKAHNVFNALDVHRAHFMLFGGPGETRETVEETIRVSAQLKETVIFPFAGMRVFPGTPLHRLTIKQGLFKAEESLFEPVFYYSPNLSKEWLEQRLADESAIRTNFVLADELQEKADLVARLLARGRATGPQWEHLIR